jgi:hypothetical protein
MSERNVPNWDLGNPQPVTPESCRADLARTLDAGEMRVVDALIASMRLGGGAHPDAREPNVDAAREAVMRHYRSTAGAGREHGELLDALIRAAAAGAARPSERCSHGLNQCSLCGDPSGFRRGIEVAAKLVDDDAGVHTAPWLVDHIRALAPAAAGAAPARCDNRTPCADLREHGVCEHGAAPADGGNL